MVEGAHETGAAEVRKAPLYVADIKPDNARSQGAIRACGGISPSAEVQAVAAGPSLYRPGAREGQFALWCRFCGASGTLVRGFCRPSYSAERRNLAHLPDCVRQSSNVTGTRAGSAGKGKARSAFTFTIEGRAFPGKGC